jgi:hypothetical protein
MCEAGLARVRGTGDLPGSIRSILVFKAGADDLRHPCQKRPCGFFLGIGDRLDDSGIIGERRGLPDRYTQARRQRLRG